MTSRTAMPLLLGCVMTLMASAAAQAAGPTCLYQSRSYSEGAYICVQRSLMQTCASDGAWRVVIDRELSDRCVAPLAFTAPRKRIVHRARVIRQTVAAPQAEPASAKCFVFNGRRYCE
jgi:hypothetical protein